jgi:TonB-dependent starch-binding outer membrane protein SusC
MTKSLTAGVMAALLCAGTAGCARSTPPADAPSLDPVPVGYGTQEREDITGSVSSVRVEETRGMRYTSVEEMLAGRVAGVQVIRTSGGISVRIRGAGSLRANMEPLYVVDGMVIIAGRSGSGVSVSPQEIARIEVLKDAAASAMYGGRGANGVVIITTKRAP